MSSATQGTQGQLVNVKGTMQSGCGAQNCRVCLHVWDTAPVPHWAVVSRGNKGVEQPGRGEGGGIQETPGGGAKTSKVAAIMAADGH